MNLWSEKGCEFYHKNLLDEKIKACILWKKWKMSSLPKHNHFFLFFLMVRWKKQLNIFKYILPTIFFVKWKSNIVQVKLKKHLYRASIWNFIKEYMQDSIFMLCNYIFQIPQNTIYFSVLVFQQTEIFDI